MTNATDGRMGVMRIEQSNRNACGMRCMRPRWVRIAYRSDIAIAKLPFSTAFLCKPTASNPCSAVTVLGIPELTVRDDRA